MNTTLNPFLMPNIYSITKFNKKLNQLDLQQQTNDKMPKSFITRLEILCQETFNTSDISVARKAVETLICASKSGCCFLEKYIVMLLNFCTSKISSHGSMNVENNDDSNNDETIKIKIEELLNRVLIVDFNRQQLIENLRRPEYKLTSIDHIIQLLNRVKDKLDHREDEKLAIDWLLVLLDAYFVEIATNDRAVIILDKISEHIDFQCALLREMESTKCLLSTIMEQLDNNDKITSNQTSTSTDTATRQLSKYRWPNYSIEYLEF